MRVAFTVTSEQLKKTYELQMAKLQHATPQAPLAKPWCRTPA